VLSDSKRFTATLREHSSTHRVKENRKACQSRTGASPPQLPASMHASFISPLHKTTAAVRRPKSTLNITANTPRIKQALDTLRRTGCLSRPPATPRSPLRNVKAKVKIRNHTPYSSDSKCSRYIPTRYGTVSSELAYLVLTTTKLQATTVLSTAISCNYSLP